MATAKIINKFSRHLKDPAQLTPYEEKLLEMRNSGMTYRQIAEALANGAKTQTIVSKFQAIREKLELLESEND